MKRILCLGIGVLMLAGALSATGIGYRAFHLDQGFLPGQDVPHWTLDKYLKVIKLPNAAADTTFVYRTGFKTMMASLSPGYFTGRSLFLRNQMATPKSGSALYGREFHTYWYYKGSLVSQRNMFLGGTLYDAIRWDSLVVVRPALAATDSTIIDVNGMY